jgi:predicted dehydrogenase
MLKMPIGNNERSLHLAIIGCGQIVTHHLEALLNLNTPIYLQAVVDPSAERRKVICQLYRSLQNKKNNDNNNNNSSGITDDKSKDNATTTDIVEFDSLDALLSVSEQTLPFDILFIAVPHDLHETLAVQALQHTNHSTRTTLVVLEKPLAPTREACDRLLQASIAYNHRLVIAEQSPYWQEIVMAKQLIQQGTIGQVITAQSYYYESMRDNITSGSIEQDGVGLGWRGSLQRAGGGIAIDGGLHWIRPLREMCGRITDVVGVIRRNLAPELRMEAELESLGHALFKMEPAESGPLQQPPGAGPLVTTFSCTMLSTAPMAHDKCPYFRITGNKGELVVHGDGLCKTKPGAGGLCLYNEENPLGKELFDAQRKGGFFLGFTGLWKEIIRIYLEQDKASAHETVIRAADDVRVVLALYKSSKTGQWEQT